VSEQRQIPLLILIIKKVITNLSNDAIDMIDNSAKRVFSNRANDKIERRTLGYDPCHFLLGC
jgi:hypothetical protein